MPARETPCFRPGRNDSPTLERATVADSRASHWSPSLASTRGCLELEPVGCTAGLVVLQVDGAAAGRGRQVDPQVLQLLLVRGEPVTERVRVIGWYDGDFCKGESLSMWNELLTETALRSYTGTMVLFDN